MPRWNSSSGPTHGREPEQEIPFIPPGIDEEGDDEEEEEDQHHGITHTLLRLKPYRFRPSKNSWKHTPTSGLHVNPDKEYKLEERKEPCENLRIITWNIDFAADHKEERLDAALRHIELDVLRCKGDQAPEPCVIMLQEVHVSLLPYILNDEWVRSWFVVTPFTKEKWPQGSYYGNVTLIARSLNIAECHILHYGVSAQQRTSLCVKVKLHYPGTQEKAVIAIVNTHLESLTEGQFARPKQLEMCARFLRLNGVRGGVIAGDMNAISPEDATIAKEVGLRDSWRRGDADNGKTWGYQGNKGNYPMNRLDKILYLPGMGYKLDEPRRIGVGARIREGTQEELWVSDHYGLETTLRMLPRKQRTS